MSVDMFMKIKGSRSGDIKGESRDKVHKDEIDVFKWNWGMSASIDASTAQRTGRTQVSHFTFTKYIDKSSPILANAVLTNELLKEATLVCRRRGKADAEPVEFLIIKFEKAVVAKISRNVEHDEDRFFEDVTLAFVKFTEDYKEITLDGSRGDQTSVAYDIGSNQ